MYICIPANKETNMPISEIPKSTLGDPISRFCE